MNDEQFKQIYNILLGLKKAIDDNTKAIDKLRQDMNEGLQRASGVRFIDEEE